METAQPITVVLVDDHAIVRGGIRALLEKNADFRVVGEAGCIEEVSPLLERTKPTVALVDIQLANNESGLDVIPVIRCQSPETRVVVLSAFLNPSILHRCLDEGIEGYLIKDTRELDLASAMRVVANGGQVFDPRVFSLERRMANGTVDGLTPREDQVLELVCKGLSNAEIADAINLSESAVKAYVSNIMRRLGCKNRVQVVLRARELNFI